MLCVQITGAEVHDKKPAFEMMALLNHRAIDRFVGDKGYDDDGFRDALKSWTILPEIPPRHNRRGHRPYDQTVYAWRRRVENMFARIKENRRLAMRVDKLDLTFMDFIALALIKLQVC